MKNLSFWMLAFCLVISTVGCGGGAGGATGDENDPAASTDEEMMQDETGDADTDGGEE